jgi:hypothetical protein
VPGITRLPAARPVFDRGPVPFDSIARRDGAAFILALAPVCVDNFNRAGNVPANLEALKKVESWSQGDFVEKGGWAKTPGTHPAEQTRDVAKACASLLIGA